MSAVVSQEQATAVAVGTAAGSPADRAAAEREAWIERELAKAGPLTQQQQAELRRVLLPPKQLRKPA